MLIKCILCEYHCFYDEVKLAVAPCGSSEKNWKELHTHKDRKHKNTQPGVYKIPCECGKVYIGETGRSFNTRIKEHKACQRLGDGDRSAIVKHAQEQQHNINWEDSSLITSIPHWHTRRVWEAIEILQHNTVPQDSGLHINNIWHPLLQKTQGLLHPGPQPAQHQVASLTSATTHKSSTLQSSSHSPEDGQHRLTEISRHLFNLNSSFQNYHMVLPQALPHHLKTPWNTTEIISLILFN